VKSTNSTLYTVIFRFGFNFYLNRLIGVYLQPFTGSPPDDTFKTVKMVSIFYIFESTSKLILVLIQNIR